MKHANLCVGEFATFVIYTCCSTGKLKSSYSSFLYPQKSTISETIGMQMSLSMVSHPVPLKKVEMYDTTLKSPWDWQMNTQRIRKNFFMPSNTWLQMHSLLVCVQLPQWHLLWDFHILWPCSESQSCFCILIIQTSISSLLGILCYHLYCLENMT